MSDVYVNQKTYDRMIELLDYEPSNLKVSSLVEDNNAIVINTSQQAWYRPKLQEELKL